MDGLTAASTIRQLEAAQPFRGALPIIAVTAHTDITMEQKIMNVGMQVFT